MIWAHTLNNFQTKHLTPRQLKRKTRAAQYRRNKTLLELLNETKSRKEIAQIKQQKQDYQTYRTLKIECFDKSKYVNDEAGKETILDEEVNAFFVKGLVLTSNHGYGAFN